MADLMAHWLRDLGMAKEINSFEEDFSNGYR